MGKRPGPNHESLEITRRIFLEAAYKEFTTNGYYAASTANIVAQSGMARGSLYYHFGDKKGLFKAVYEQEMIKMSAAIATGADKADNSWDCFVSACITGLDLCMKNDLRRIIVDVHTALTYRERYEILQRTVLVEMSERLRAAMKDGHFKGYTPKALVLMIFGMISEAGRSFEIADNVEERRNILADNLTMMISHGRA